MLHRSRDELAALLPTLPRRTQLVVVDNGPDDGGAALAARHGATVIERRDNPGFGAACNLALEHVTEDVTVLLNPDTEPVDSALGKLVQRARPGGLHAPRLVDPDGSVQRSAHPLPGTLGAFLPALSRRWPPAAPSRSAPSSRARSAGRSPRRSRRRPTRCVSSGRSTPRSTCLPRTWTCCLRARAQGIRTIYHPDLRICHTGRHSLDHEPFEQLARNRRAVIERNRGKGARRLDDAAQALTFATRIAVKRPNDRERAQLSALLKQRDPGDARAS